MTETLNIPKASEDLSKLNMSKNNSRLTKPHFSTANFDDESQYERHTEQEVVESDQRDQSARGESVIQLKGINKWGSSNSGVEHL
jgi:hypothetical protein